MVFRLSFEHFWVVFLLSVYQIRYRKDKVQSKQTPVFVVVSGVKDLSNGCAIAAALHFYCPQTLPLEGKTQTLKENAPDFQKCISLLSASLCRCVFEGHHVHGRQYVQSPADQRVLWKSPEELLPPTGGGFTVCPTHFTGEICLAHFTGATCPAHFTGDICPAHFTGEICPAHFTGELCSAYFAGAISLPNLPVK